MGIFHVMREAREYGVGVREMFAYNAAQARDTAEGWSRFLRKYPHSGLSEAAQGCLDYARQHAERQRSELFSNLGTRLRAVTKVDETINGCRIFVRAHLVEGCRVDDPSPYVVWLYRTRPLLSQELRKRVSQIVSEVFACTSRLPVEMLTVELTHGIRQGGEDVVATVYSAHVNGKRAQKYHWKVREPWGRIGPTTDIDEDQVQRVLSVEINMVPQLQFLYESRKR